MAADVASSAASMGIVFIDWCLTRLQVSALAQQAVAATDLSCLHWWAGGESFLLSVMVQVLGMTGGLFVQHACVKPHQTAFSCTVLPSAFMAHISAVQLRQ